MVTSPMSNVPLVPFPDGSIMPSIVFRHKQLVTLTPTTGGVIAFSMIPGVDGGLMVNGGNGWSYSVPEVTTASANFTAFNAYTNPVAPTTNNLFYILPYQEYPRGTNLASKAAVPFYASQYRVLAQEMTASYTGTSFADSGAVVIDRRSSRPEYDARSQFSANTQPGAYMITQVNTFPTITQGFASGSTVSMPARQSYRCRQVATRPVFNEVYQNRGLSAIGGPPLAGVAAYNTTTNSIENNWYHGFDSNLPLTSVFYTGLASSASITVEVATVVEYAITAGSPLSGMATPNPPEEPAVNSYLGKLYAAMPTAEAVSGFMDQALRVGTTYLANGVMGNPYRANLRIQN